jgi:hypothetical protein
LQRLLGRRKLLSQAAGTTLLKSVANAIPTYLMFIFLFLKSICSDIDTTLLKFWWGFPQEKKHNLSFLSWHSICQPKALGGLGIRSMELLNKALLSRLGWKLTSNQPLLWVDVLRSTLSTTLFSQLLLICGLLDFGKDC